MNRAVRSIQIQPTLRRNRRRLNQYPLFHNLQKRCVSDRNKRTKQSFSSITFDGGDGRIGTSHDGNLALRRSQREERRVHRTERVQKQRRRAHDSGKTKRIGDLSVFASIHEAQDLMQDLLDRLVAIDSDPSSRIAPITVQNLAWENVPGNYFYNIDSDYNSWMKRISIFREAGEFFNVLVRSVEKGLLSPSRKHGKDLSQLAECLLYVCNQQQPLLDAITESEPVQENDDLLLEPSEIIGAVEEVLKALEMDWNLDVSHRHYEQAIAAACNCRDWKVASELFEKQIDPNAGGSPVQLSVENPLGLYAMAQRYQQEHLVQEHEDTESLVAEQIMDAVQRLVMVSPQDQNTYVLAAGNALGHSGCWRELNEYRKSSFVSERYGMPLLAAVLRACLLCEEYDAALEILVDENILTPSLLPMAELGGSYRTDDIDPFSASSSSASNLEEEWQWGGARDRMDPLIRDLAMQVIGGASSMVGSRTNEGDLDRKIYDYCDSRLALELFRQSLEEGLVISQEALLGVTEACEHDKDWRGALSVLRTILEEEEMRLRMSDSNTTKLAPWIVPCEQLSIVERDQIEDSSIDVIGILPNLGPILASVMRNCNSSSNFGLSLFALQLFQTQLLRNANSVSNTNDSSSAEDGIANLLNEMNIATSSQVHEEIVVASMVALSGLRCHKNAMRLYERTMRDLVGDSEDIENSAASFVYQYASLNQKRHGTLLLGNPWLSAHDHVDRLTKAGVLIRTIRQENKTTGLHDRQREGVEELLAHAMNSCTNAHQPELSLYLLRWMEESVFATPRDAHSFWTKSNRDLVSPIDVEEHLYGDSVTAETILAHRWTKDLPGAIELFEGILEKHAEDDLVRWRKTIGAGLTAMVASGRGNDAVKVFEVLDGKARSTASYTTIGRHLSKVKDWKELIDLYRDATKEGYSSEELSLLAMLAVTSTRVDNRLRILRAIVDECANSVGLDSKQWTMAKYWQLKRTLGFYHARLLMWWNDEERAPLDEVNLAIKEFYNEKAKKMRPKNDVVRAIFSGAQQHAHLGLELEEGYEKVPRSPDRWAALLGDVLHTLGDSPVRYDPNFVDSVVQAYQSLGKHKECIDYISGVLEVERTRIRRSTLEDVLEIAKTEQDFGLCQDIEMLLYRKSGGDDSGEYSHSSNP